MITHVSLDREWQKGKTVATINFINHANRIISAGCCTDDEKSILLSAIDSAKEGRIVFTETTTPDAYIKKKKQANSSPKVSPQK